jgi:NDP-sugar pyrophosphorylase family protein
MVGPRVVIRGGSRIEAGATIVESVLLGDNGIGAGAEVEGAILATGVQVEEGARVERGAVIGRAARIASGALVGEGARVAPEEVVAK